MKFSLPLIVLAAYVGLPAAPADSCSVIVPDVQYRCTGRALEPSRHNVTYMSWMTDNIMASNAKNPLQAGDVVVATNRLLVEHDWVTRVANASPNYFMMISARRRTAAIPPPAARAAMDAPLFGWIFMSRPPERGCSRISPTSMASTPKASGGPHGSTEKKRYSTSWYGRKGPAGIQPEPNIIRRSIPSTSIPE